MKDHWGLYAIIVLLIALLFQHRCAVPEYSRSNKRDTSILSIHNHYDSIPKIITVQVSQPKDSILISIPANVDTAAILQLYFTKYHFRQEISDSNITAIIDDTIARNSILARSFTYQWKKPQIIETTIQPEVEIKKTKVFAGIHAGSCLNTPIILGPELGLMNKKENFFSIRADPFNKSVSGSALLKIRIKGRNRDP